MEKEIRDRYNDEILQEAMRRYGIAAGSIELLGTVESFIYAYKKDGEEHILRLGHSKRRTPDLIRGEVDWINYLAAGGAGVAQAVASQSGELVEEIPDAAGGRFLATAFVRAQGGPEWETGGWTDERIESYGHLLGRIHALSKNYTLANEAWRRPQWDDPSNVGLGPVEPQIEKKLWEVVDYLRALPRGGESYGMIHQDAHSNNFFIDENGRFTLFDFDDCCYGHFAYDLAMVLFYTVTNLENVTEFAPHFWQTFMRGYNAENDLDPAWQQEIPHFMKLREIDLYAVILRDYDSIGGDWWAEGFMNGRRERIVEGLPYAGIRMSDLGFGS
ncbi:MAG: phosphotransferase enzyme family protein [Candidatus Promineifilaceae bacterium]